MAQTRVLGTSCSRWSRPVAAGGLALVAAAGSAMGSDGGSTAALDLEPVGAVFRATGESRTLPVRVVYHPLCGGEPGALGDDARVGELVAMHERSAAAAGGEENGGGFRISQAGFDVVFTTIGGVPSGAQAGLDAAEAYLESMFDDNVRVELTVEFAPLGGSTLGQAISTFVGVTYPETREALVAADDGDDRLAALLPPGDFLPVRYGGLSPTVTSEPYIWVTVAEFLATFGALEEEYVAAHIQFNTAFAWDFDPSNGVSSGTTSFIDVVVHEVTHALGFSSAIETTTVPNRLDAPTVMDVFRFQRTDGVGIPYNPQSDSDFTLLPRLVSYNAPDDDHILDLVDAEYRMSDGYPSQAGHFRDETPSIGIMDPTLAKGETFYPDYLQESDLQVLDALGYEPSSPEPACPADRDGDGDKDVQDLLSYLRAFRARDADMDGDLDTDVQDLLAYLRAFRAGCTPS